MLRIKNKLSCTFFILCLFYHGAAVSGPVDTGSLERGSTSSSGAKYSVEFRNADLKDALRFLSKVADINIMIPEDVVGLVSTSFESTTLQDAINSIVKANGLDYAVERGIWRVGKSDQFTTSGEDLKTETFRLRYASAKDLTEKVKDLLTSRGSVLSDERTNSLVVRERPANIENVRNFLQDIDVRDAQVLIEAKIVEATRDFSRNLGIQWGVKSTGTVDLQGVSSVGTADSGNTLMTNLPMPTTSSVTSPTSGVGLLIGTFANATSIDVQITAAEQKGDLDIISEPTIVTSNGVSANIRSGETIYVKTTGDISIGGTGSSSSSTTGGSSGLQEVETGIELTVTPQISADGFIKLSIETKTSQLDFTRTVDGIPVIIDSNATTAVVVRDGETTIIGGMAKLTGSKTRRNVPLFSKIPLLGNLFKSRAKYRQNKELMIFIKPTIITSSALVQQNVKYEKVEGLREELVIEDEKPKEAKKFKKISDKSKARNKYLRDK
jgi:type IV pilus assembly protein PilQ